MGHGRHGPDGNLPPPAGWGRPADPVELFQLMRSDFEAVLERYPLLRSRLTKIGQAHAPDGRLHAQGLDTRP